MVGYSKEKMRLGCSGVQLWDVKVSGVIGLHCSSVRKAHYKRSLRLDFV
jgi:hypothetical protein